MIVGLDIRRALAKSSVLLGDEAQFSACQVWWEPGCWNRAVGGEKGWEQMSVRLAGGPGGTASSACLAGGKVGLKQG